MLVCCLSVLIFVVLFSLVGLGSATAVVPLLVFFGYPPATAIAYALLVNVISSIVINFHLVIEGSHDIRRGLCIVLPAFVFSLPGGFVSGLLPGKVLLGAFAAFLFYSSFSILGILKKPSGKNNGFYHKDISPGKRCLYEVFLGAGVGFLAGLLGIGGGSILLPVLVNMGLEPVEVIPVVSMSVLLSSLGGFLSHLAFGGIKLTEALLFALIASAGAYIGNRLRKKLGSDSLKKVLAFVLLGLAIKVLFKIFH